MRIFFFFVFFFSFENFLYTPKRSLESTEKHNKRRQKLPAMNFIIILEKLTMCICAGL